MNVQDSKAGYPPNPLRRKAAIANLPSSTVVFDSDVDVPATTGGRVVTLLMADSLAFLLVSVHYKSPRPTSSIQPFEFMVEWKHRVWAFCHPSSNRYEHYHQLDLRQLESSFSQPLRRITVRCKAYMFNETRASNTMRLFVRCDRKGKIVSAMKVRVMSATLEHPFAQPLGEGEQVLEIKPDPSTAALDVHEIVEEFAVDTATGKLRKLTEAGPLGRESALPPPQRRTAPKKTKRK